MKEIVFLNGKFLNAREARLPVLSPGFLYGWGLFETMRSYNNKIVYLDQHLKRMKASGNIIGMRLNYSMVQLKEIIWKTVKINGFKDTYVRLTLWKSASGTDILAAARKYVPGERKQTFRACTSLLKQNEESLLARIKTTNYLLYKIAYLEAENKGFDEAIILNNRGLICEASRNNIFLIKDSQIFTPSLSCGCLDGITRKVIFDLAKRNHGKICEGNFTLRDLYAADEAFLTNSLAGVTPLISIEKYIIGKGAIGRLTKYFMNKYNQLLKNGN